MHSSIRFIYFPLFSRVEHLYYTYIQNMKTRWIILRKFILLSFSTLFPYGLLSGAFTNKLIYISACPYIIKFKTFLSLVFHSQRLIHVLRALARIVEFARTRVTPIFVSASGIIKARRVNKVHKVAIFNTTSQRTVNKNRNQVTRN